MTNQTGSETELNEMLASNTRGKQGWIVLIIAWVLFLVPIPFVGTFFGGFLVFVAMLLAMIQLGRKDGGLGLLLTALLGSPVVYFIGFLLMGAVMAG